MTLATGSGRVLHPLPRRHTMPALVLLPGMDGTGDLFAPLVRALRPQMRTIIVRYPDEARDYPSHEAIARAALPVGEPFILLGESFSGPIVVSIAASAPAGLEGYVLCCSFVRSPRLLLRWLWPCLGLLRPHDVPAAVTGHFLFGRFGTAELRQLHADALRKVSTRTLVARLRAIAHVDATEPLHRVGLPGLYLRATEDRLVPRSASALFARLAPKARMVELEGPHLLLQARPDAAAGILQRFAELLPED